MREILSTEQPCVLCGMALQVVTICRDDATGAERIDRVDLPHDLAACARMLSLYPEVWPTYPRRP